MNDQSNQDNIVFCEKEQNNKSRNLKKGLMKGKRNVKYILYYSHNYRRRECWKN